MVQRSNTFLDIPLCATYKDTGMRYLQSLTLECQLLVGNLMLHGVISHGPAVFNYIVDMAVFGHYAPAAALVTNCRFIAV